MGKTTGRDSNPPDFADSAKRALESAICRGFLFLLSVIAKKGSKEYNEKEENRYIQRRSSDEFVGKQADQRGNSNTFIFGNSFYLVVFYEKRAIFSGVGRVEEDGSGEEDGDDVVGHGGDLRFLSFGRVYFPYDEGSSNGGVRI